MIIAKLIGTSWMLIWFFIIFKSMVKAVNNGLDPFAAIFSLAFVWGIIGFLPIAIIKFGWGFIK